MKKNNSNYIIQLFIAQVQQMKSVENIEYL